MLYENDVRSNISKDNLISKTIAKVFTSVQRVFVYLNGKKYPAFSGICLNDTKKQDRSIDIDSALRAEHNEHGDLKITCPTIWTVNDVHLEISGEFRAEKLLIRLNDAEVSNSLLGVPSVCEVNQKTLDGICHILKYVRLCRGKLLTDDSDVRGKSDVGCWANLLNSDKEQRLRSTHCERVVHWSSILDVCQPCKRLLWRKRNAPSIEPPPSEEKVAELKDHEMGSEESDVITLGQEYHDAMTTMIQGMLENEAQANENFKLLLRTQLTNINKEPKARRWDKNVIRVCLAMYCRSPRTYEDLKSTGMLVLPSTRLLRYYKNAVNQMPGLHEDQLSWMEQEAVNAGLSEFGRRGGILLDEMTIQDDIQIIKNGDGWTIVGMTDMGEVCNNIDTIINGKRTMKMATHVLQFVFHGFTGFRWPVAYYGSSVATSHELYRIVWEVLDKLDSRDFTVDYLMMDGGSANRSLTNILLPPDHRESGYRFRNIFDTQKQICLIQDVKHCLKKNRNGIESSKEVNKSETKGRYLIRNGQSITWDHFEEANIYNTQCGMRIHYRLTADHIQLTPASKMRNELATSVLDRNMLYLMKAYQTSIPNPERLASTIDLLECTSTLVDIFCDVNRPLRQGDSRLTDISKCLDFFNDWEKQVTTTNSLSERKHLLTKECRDDINSCLLGFLSLTETVLGDGNAINPGFFNSDLIENFFCQQRGIRNGCNTNPTLSQYGPAVNAICLGQTTVSGKSNTGNQTQVFSATKPGNLIKKKTTTLK